jgi:hypothetical protein
MNARRAITTGALAALALGAWAGTAQAGAVKTPNACWSSFESRYRQLPVTLSGTASPVSPKVGRAVTVGGLRVRSALPNFFPVTGYNLGILKKGRNVIPTTVYVAVATNGTPRVRWVKAAVSSITTITDPDGRRNTGDERATPIVLNAGIPNVAFTAAQAGAMTFRQAGKGVLPSIPGAGAGGKAYPATGSVFVSARIGAVRVNFDCRPGTVKLTSVNTYKAVTARPFATVTARR